MKKSKVLFFILTVVVMLLSACSNAQSNSKSNSNSQRSYDTITLDNAEKITTSLGFNDSQSNPFKNSNRYFEVKRTSNQFDVDVNGTKMLVKFSDNNQKESKLKPKKIKSLSSKYEKIYSKSKEMVYNYIENSSILKKKKDIKKYLENLDVKEAIFTDDINDGAYFSDEDDTIYINSDNSEVICEWMIIHELIHAIAYYTHGCNNEEYAYYIFNEVMTDIITSSFNPDIDSSIQSMYMNYSSLVYPYINLVGQEAIKAYFYGYESIYNKVGRDEFDFYVIVIQHYNEENSEAYYNNLIFKWYATH